MIRAENISKSFGKFEALHNVNLDLGSNECIALIGPNGCGKTTLIKCILGLVIPSKGKIVFNGNDIQNDFTYKNNIGYMPQIGRYPQNMTVRELLVLIKTIRNQKNNIDEELIENFKLWQLYPKRLGTLSGGSTQKVSAALAFLFDPKVLILDEPTAGLDPLAAEILKEKIKKEHQKEKLIIITSHLLSELDELITNVIFMQDGNVKFHKTVNEIVNETKTEKISKAIIQILRSLSHE